MKLTKTTLLTTTLLSVFLIGQTAVAGQAPAELSVFKNTDSIEAQYSTSNDSRVNYSVTNADLTDTSDLFTDHER